MKKPIALSILILILLGVIVVQYQYIRMSSSPTTNTKQGYSLNEPNSPVNLDDPPFFSLPLPTNEIPIKTVITKGQQIPVEFIYNNPEWKRQSYKEYWHSSYHRWSYVPNRIHFAMHRLFATYPTASIYYDFIHDLGISEESRDFRQYLSENQFPYTYLQVVVMNTSISKIYTYQNQIVIVGRPQRTNLQAIIIPSDKIKPVGDHNNILIQLATSEGDEMDYTVVALVNRNK